MSFYAVAAVSLMLMACSQSPAGSGTAITLDNTPPSQVAIQEVLVLTEASGTTTSAASVQQLQALAANVRAGGTGLTAQSTTPADLPSGYVVKYALRYVAPSEADVDASTYAVYVDGLKVTAPLQLIKVVAAGGGYDTWAIVTTSLTQSGVVGNVGMTVQDKTGNESARLDKVAVAALAPAVLAAPDITNKALSYGAVEGAVWYTVGIFENLAGATGYSLTTSPALWDKTTTGLTVSYAGDPQNLGVSPQAWAVLSASSNLSAFSISAKNF